MARKKKTSPNAVPADQAASTAKPEAAVTPAKAPVQQSAPSQRPATPSERSSATAAVEQTAEADCAAILRMLNSNSVSRAKARTAFKQLAKDHPGSELPHRYLARLLYHEAACSDELTGERGPGARLALLRDALLAAAAATDAAPASLACAALRATLVVNLLVENGRGQAGGSIEAAVAEMRAQLRTGIAAAETALRPPPPLAQPEREPIIVISSGGHQTADPCCQNVMAQATAWVSAGRWQELAAEKTAALSQMARTLETYSRLLESPAPPADGAARLLQQVMRLAPEILAVQAAGAPGSGRGGSAATAAPPAWATQVLESVAAAARLPGGFGAQGATYPPGNYTTAERRELARRLETQSTAAWLLQKLNGRGPNGAGGAGGAYGYGMGSNQLPPPGVLGGGAHQLSAFGGGGVSVQDGAPPPLSVECDWDVVAREAAAAARKRPSRRPGAGSRPERTPLQRFQSVRQHWTSLSPDRRRRLLTVPVKRLARATRLEQGNEAAHEVAHALRLLQERGDRHAAFWACPPCDCAFPSSSEFAEHLYTYHEEAVYADEAAGTYLTCSHCGQEIVGAYYRSPAAAGFQLCTRCNAAAGGNGAGGGSGGSASQADGAGQLVCVRAKAPALPPPWEEAGSEDSRNVADPDDFELRLSQLQGFHQYSPDALASLYASGDAAGAAAAASAGWGLAPHFMPATASTTAQRPLTPSPDVAAGASKAGGSSNAAGKPPPAPGTPSGSANGGGDSGSSEGGPAFAFGQLTSTLPEPLTFGGSPSADGRTTPTRVTSPSRARSPARASLAGTVTSPLSPARSGHPHKRAREEDSAPPVPPAAAVGAATGPRPGFGGSSLPAQPPRVPRAAVRQHPGGSAPGSQAQQQRAAAAMPVAGAPVPPGEPRGASGVADTQGRHCVVEDTDEDGDSVVESDADASQPQDQSAGTWRTLMQDNPLARRIKEWQLGKLPFGFSGSGGAGGGAGNERTGRSGPADSVQSLDMGHTAGGQANGAPGQADKGEAGPSSSASSQMQQRDLQQAQLQAQQQQLQLQQQHFQLQQQQLQQQLVPHAGAALQAPGVTEQALSQLLTDHFTQHQPDHEAMVSMVMAEVQQMANTQNGDAFHERFVGVIARIQELLRQSREQQSAASFHGAGALADAASEAGSSASHSRDRGSRSSASRSASGDSGDGGSSTGSAIAEAGSSGSSRALEDFMCRPAEEVWSQLERNGVSELQEVLGHLGRPQLGQLLQEMIVAMHGISAYPNAPSDGQGDGSEDECIGCFSLFQFSANMDSAALEAALAAAQQQPRRIKGRDSGGGGSGSDSESGDDVALEVNSWWLEHLEERDGARDDGQLQVLRWVYGGLACAQNLDFLERQAEVLPGGAAPAARASAVGALLDDLAAAWRRYQHTLDCKRKAAQLSALAKRHFMAVRRMEDAGTAAPLRRAAAAYREAYVAAHDAQQASGPEAQQRADALRAQLQQYSILSSDDAFRYAAELVAREEAALGLVREMLGYEGREAARDAAAAEQRLAAARLDAADADAELARAQAEGPASHRKRDYIDKATKEAEHRDRLAELRARGDAARERAAAEQELIMTCRLRREQADKDLGGVAAALARQADMADKLAEALARPGAAGSVPPQDAILQMFIARLDLAEIIIEYGGSFEAGAGTLRLYVHAVALARAAADAAQQAMEKEFQAIDALKERLQLAACVDMSVELSDAALNFIRNAIESAAAKAQDAATAHLLAELEAEEAAEQRKAGEKAKRRKSKAAARRRAADSASEVSPPELLPAGVRIDEESDSTMEPSQGGDIRSEVTSQQDAAETASVASEPAPQRAAAQQQSSPAAKQQQQQKQPHQPAAEQQGEPATAQPKQPTEQAAAPKTKAQKRAEQRLAKQQAAAAAAAADSSSRQQAESAVKEQPKANGTAQQPQSSLADAPNPEVLSAWERAQTAAEEAELRAAIEASLLDAPPPVSNEPKAAAVPKSPAKGAGKAQAAAAGGKASIKAPPPASPARSSKSAAEWQAVAPVPATEKKRRRKKGKGEKEEAEEAAAAPAAAPKADSQMRIVSYFGHWLCDCGRENALWDRCACGQVGPCRDWVRGRCQYGSRCHFSHLPFDLPPGPPNGDPIAKPAPDAPRWQRPGTAAAAASSLKSAAAARAAAGLGPKLAPAAAKPAASEAAAPPPATPRQPAAAPAARPAWNKGAAAADPPAAGAAAQEPVQPSAWDKRPSLGGALPPALPASAPPPPPPAAGSTASSPAQPSIAPSPAAQDPPPPLPPPQRPPAAASQQLQPPPPPPPQPQQPHSSAPLPPPQRAASASAPVPPAGRAPPSQPLPLGAFDRQPSGALPPPRSPQQQPQPQSHPPSRQASGPLQSSQQQSFQQQAQPAEIPQMQMFGPPSSGPAVSQQQAANGMLWGGGAFGGLSSGGGGGGSDAYNPFGDNPLLRAFASDRRLETAPSLGSIGSATAAAATLQRPASAAAESMADASGLSDSIMSMLQLNDSHSPSAASAAAASVAGSSQSAPRPPSRQHSQQPQQPLQQPFASASQPFGAAMSQSFGASTALSQPRSSLHQQLVGSGGSLPPASAPHSLGVPSRPHSVASSSRTVTPTPAMSMAGGSAFGGPPGFSPARGFGPPPMSAPGPPQQQQLGQGSALPPAFVPRPNGIGGLDIGGGNAGGWSAGGGLPGLAHWGGGGGGMQGFGGQQQLGNGLGNGLGGLAGHGGPIAGADSGRQFLEALAAGLWALPPLRAVLAEVNPAALSGKPGGHAAMALRSLFAALSAQQQQGNGGGASVAAVPEHVRNALWRDFSTAGLVREVRGGDAGSAVEGALAGLDHGAWPGAAASPLAAVLGLPVDELLHCRSCGRTSLEAHYTRFALAVPAGALAPERSSGPGGPQPLEAAVAAATGLAARACPLEQGGCGTLNLVQGAVRAAPRSLALCLAWGAAPPSDADLAMVLGSLPPRLDARAAFPGAEANGSLPPGYRLAAAVVGRAGGVAFAALVADGRDGNVWAAAAAPGTATGPLGDWRSAFGHCRAARLQPLVLLYSAAG